MDEFYGPGDMYSGAPYWTVRANQEHYYERILVMLSIWWNGPQNAYEADLWISANFPTLWTQSRQNQLAARFRELREKSQCIGAMIRGGSGGLWHGPIRNIVGRPLPPLILHPTRGRHGEGAVHRLTLKGRGELVNRDVVSSLYGPGDGPPEVGEELTT